MSEIRSPGTDDIVSPASQESPAKVGRHPLDEPAPRILTCATAPYSQTQHYRAQGRLGRCTAICHPCPRQLQAIQSRKHLGPVVQCEHVG